jgi:hypothetical protein
VLYHVTPYLSKVCLYGFQMMDSFPLELQFFLIFVPPIFGEQKRKEKKKKNPYKLE